MPRSLKIILFTVVLFLAVLIYGVYYLYNGEFYSENVVSWEEPQDGPPKEQRGLLNNVNNLQAETP